MSLNFATTPTLQFFSRDRFTPTLSANNSVVLQFLVPINLGNKLSAISTGLAVVYEYLEFSIAINLECHNDHSNQPCSKSERICFPEEFFMLQGPHPVN